MHNHDTSKPMIQFSPVEGGNRVIPGRRRFVIALTGMATLAMVGEKVFLPQLAVAASSNISEETAQMTRFLERHTFSDGMPRIFSPPTSWESVGLTDAQDVDQVIEAFIIENGAGLYDAAARQIVLARAGKLDAANSMTQALLQNRWGQMTPWRAYKGPFRYGGKRLAPETSLFFRIFSQDYLQKNLLNGKRMMSPYALPSGKPWPFDWPPQINWTDWKPIMGDNVWGSIIGPLQVAHARHKGQIPRDAPEVTLAMSIVPALAAMQTDIGAIYHAAEGTADKRPDEIAIENIVSARAALDLLFQVTQDSQVEALIRGLDTFMRNHAFDPKNNVFYQGGYYKNGGKYRPSADFAVDTQTWTYLVWGPSVIEQWYGKGVAFKNWQELIQRGGFYRNGVLAGVGFTDQRTARNPVMSAEWTAGAIAAGTVISHYYESIGKKPWSEKIRSDVELMRRGVDTLKVTMSDGGIAYLYSDKPTTPETLPFGWFGRAIPSTASTAWMIYINNNINPFMFTRGLSEQPKLSVTPQDTP